METKRKAKWYIWHADSFVLLYLPYTEASTRYATIDSTGHGQTQTNFKTFPKWKRVLELKVKSKWMLVAEWMHAMTSNVIFFSSHPRSLQYEIKNGWCGIVATDGNWFEQKRSEKKFLFSFNQKAFHMHAFQFLRWCFSIQMAYELFGLKMRASLRARKRDKVRGKRGREKESETHPSWQRQIKFYLANARRRQQIADFYN